MLTNKHIEDVCCAYDASRTCRYLDLASCAKLTSQKAKIDKSANKLLNGQPLTDKDVPILGLNDNCPGYPTMKHIMQGYDV